jgi:hypothetical protein
VQGVKVQVLQIVLASTIGLLAVIAGYYYFAHNKRRKQLLFDNRRTKLIALPMGHGSEKIEVIYDGHRVNDPYIVDLLFGNIGDKDIGSKDFDGDRPLEVAIGAKIVAQMQYPQENAVLGLNCELGEQEVRILPSLFAVSQVHRTRLLVDGKPALEIVENRLLDTDIISGLMRRKRSMKVVLTAFVVAGSLALISLISNFIERPYEGKLNTWSIFVVGPWWGALWSWSNTLLTFAAIPVIVFAMIRVFRMKELENFDLS